MAATLCDYGIDVCALCGQVMQFDTDRRYKQLQYVCRLIGLRCTKTEYVYAHIMQMGHDEKMAHIRSAAGCQCCSEHDLTNCNVLNNTDTAEHEHGCNISRRVPFCIACINWVRRLCKIKKSVGSRYRHRHHKQNSTDHGTLIPMDALIHFIHEPGARQEPDKRSMCRLLYNLCAHKLDRHLQQHVNPYSRFNTVVMDNVLRLFASKYVGIRNGHKRVPTQPVKRSQRHMLQNNLMIVNDITRIWWICNGMPLVLVNRDTAKYVRRMIRNCQKDGYILS
jgi:hypothetical protein